MKNLFVINKYWNNIVYNLQIINLFCYAASIINLKCLN